MLNYSSVKAAEPKADRLEGQYLLVQLVAGDPRPYAVVKIEQPEGREQSSLIWLDIDVQCFIAYAGKKEGIIKRPRVEPAGGMVMPW